MKCDQDLCLNFWYDFKMLLWQDELNPRVRCAFGNVFIFHLSPFLSFSLFLFYLSSYFFIFHLRPGKVRAPALPPSTAVVTPLWSRCWWSWLISNGDHDWSVMMIMISFHSHSVQDDCGNVQLTPHLVRFPASLTFVIEPVGWGPWLGVTWSSRDLGRCPAGLRADVRIECNFDFGGLQGRKVL